jgi:signal transduction histidine kinase
MAAGPSLVATFGLAARRPLRRVLIVAALLVISAPLYMLIRPDGDAASIAITPVILAGVIGWGTSVRARREQQDLRVEQARQNERTRIAREMHDVLGHRLSLLSLHAGALGYGAEKSPQDTARAVAVIRESAHQALDELRAVIGVLREDGEHGAPEPPQPQLADLPALVEETRRAGMPVDTSVEVDFSTAPPVAGRHAYRIVQEGLTNARKHAYGAAVALRVEGAAGAGLEVELRNGLPDGVTLPAAGAGLLGLSERAALAGGRLEHGVTANGDFRLWAWLPWPA